MEIFKVSFALVVLGICHSTLAQAAPGGGANGAPGAANNGEFEVGEQNFMNFAGPGGPAANPQIFGRIGRMMSTIFSELGQEGARAELAPNGVPGGNGAARTNPWPRLQQAMDRYFSEMSALMVNRGGAPGARGTVAGAVPGAGGPPAGNGEGGLGGFGGFAEGFGGGWA